MKVPTIGGIVECKCGKCNDVTGHVVMAIVGGEIVKVECRACGSVHKFRPPDKPGVTRVAKAPSRKAATGTTAGTRTPARGAQARAEYDRWEKAAQRAVNAEVLPYSTTGKFEQGNLVRHPVFGLGEVLLIIPPDKTDILFETGIKRLLCNK
ncbi:hypothetical protein LJC23_04390 [Desulfovibrio sp. OttesenSCG-928-I05]|nr:hypothetical protein [Desulfovibrio sp. OttesenSCG-928-I05]